MKDMQRAFWLNHELKRKNYLGFDQRDESLDSEDDAAAQFLTANQDDRPITPDKQMLVDKQNYEEKA